MYIYIYISYICFYCCPKYIIRQPFYKTILVSEKAVRLVFRRLRRAPPVVEPFDCGDDNGFVGNDNLV